VYIINQLEPSNKTLDVRTHRENIHMKLIMSLIEQNLYIMEHNLIRL